MNATTLASLPLALLVACSTHSEPNLLTDAAAGQQVSVVVEEGPDGALLATQVRTATPDDDDDEQIPLDELPAAVQDAMEAEFPGATWLEAEKEGRTYEVEFYTEDGQRLEAEFKADGTLLEVEDESEEDDDDDGADDDDADGFRSAGPPAMVVGIPSRVERSEAYAVLGVEVHPGAQAMPDGAVRIHGAYNGERRVFATAVAPSSDAVLVVGGISQGITPTEITVLDLTIAIDERTEHVRVDRPLE